jgi:hypothetical protein
MHGSVYVLQATAIREATTEPALRNENALVNICLSGDRYSASALFRVHSGHTYCYCILPLPVHALTNVHSGHTYCYWIYF